ncbi:MAG: glycoside hydrolase family 3 N-terminal domain-containing protein [Cyanobacteria bacterium P01_H01_bin.15]
MDPASIVSQWSLEQQIAQMIVVRASGFLQDEQIRYPQWEPSATKLQGWLKTWNLGGVILLGGSAAELRLRTEQLQAWAQFPLWLAADIEEGVGHRFSGATWFPPPLALAEIYRRDHNLALDYAQTMGAITAKEATALGLNWLLGPVADVNNNPQNPVINVRAFGETPEIAGELASAFIKGAKKHSLLTTAKHFPGHGDTSTDSHLELPVIPHDAQRLAEIELPPFKAAITNGVDTVMSAHLLVPAWDTERAATLSPKILTGQLRENLGFTGLIVTDALIMGGVANELSPAEIAIQAVEAGADVLLMPADPEIAIAAVADAVKQGRLSSAQVETAVMRIVKAKQKVKTKPSEHPLDSLAQLMTAQAQISVTGILQQSQRENNLQAQPRTDQSSGQNLVLVDDVTHCSDYLQRHTPAIAHPKAQGLMPSVVDFATFTPELVQTGVPLLLQLFIRGNPFRGTAGLPHQLKTQLEELLQISQLQGVAIYGSPYISDWIKSAVNPDTPWVFSYGQMPEAQKIACEALLPTTRHTLTPSTEFI